MQASIEDKLLFQVGFNLGEYSTGTNPRKLGGVLEGLSNISA